MDESENFSLADIRKAINPPLIFRQCLSCQKRRDRQIFWGRNN